MYYFGKALTQGYS